LARKILLADDSVTAQNMGRRILSDAGYDVTTVNNGSAALKRIAESKPDLIVLDVYMPGYGGLEVCQRLREAPETARIPVLLTVGKLEPFKAEESRRVRADGFIVKPFEASELLTALTKLEDKIVPHSQPPKMSRFAKALADAEEPASGKEFDDSETGWKNRLSIPAPHSKSRGAVARESSAANASAGEVSRTEEPKLAEIMKSGLEEALLSSLPQDVTPEEIAAIKAAAAAFSTPSDESSFKPHPVRDPGETPAQEPIATAEERPRESSNELTQTESSATKEQTSAVPEFKSDVPTEETVPPAMIVSESTASIVPDAAHTDPGKLHADEVTAALASLSPANGHGQGAVIERDADRWEPAAREQVPVTMAVAGATEEYSGPRWIAELVPVSEDEATLILEQEMQKTYAAFAAADAARISFTSSPVTSSAFSPVAEERADDSETASSVGESFSRSESSESNPQESTAYASSSGEGSGASASELSPVTTSRTFDVVSQSFSEVEENAAYAAAASSSPGVADATSAPSPVVESSDSVASASEPNARHVESHLAAAWASWKQIRDSVAGSQVIASQVVDSQGSGSQVDGSQPSSEMADTAAERQEVASEAQAEPASNVAPATEEETSEISSLVDSVLADLKPKLMAEIARKMGKEKKK
jgi:CheY-like chemotaxis protein